MTQLFKALLVGTALLALAACETPAPALAAPPPAPAPAPVSAETAALYAAKPDGDLTVPAIPAHLLSEDKARQIVDYWTNEPVGTIIVDPHAKRLYEVRPGNTAMRYTVGVGAAGYGFTGEAHIPYQRDWPRWTPTDSMLAENPEHYGPSKDGVDGGWQIQWAPARSTSTTAAATPSTASTAHPIPSRSAPPARPAASASSTRTSSTWPRTPTA